MYVWAMPVGQAVTATMCFGPSSGSGSFSGATGSGVGAGAAAGAAAAAAAGAAAGNDRWWRGPPGSGLRHENRTRGAGDSSLAGYLAAQMSGATPADCLRSAVAYGSAAAALPGTTLPTPDHVDIDAVTVTALSSPAPDPA